MGSGWKDGAPAKARGEAWDGSHNSTPRGRRDLAPTTQAEEPRGHLGGGAVGGSTMTKGEGAQGPIEHVPCRTPRLRRRAALQPSLQCVWGREGGGMGREVP